MLWVRRWPMHDLIERRQDWRRIVGLERRGAPLATLAGRPLPDPTQLRDEDFVGWRVLPVRRGEGDGD